MNLSLNSKGIMLIFVLTLFECSSAKNDKRLIGLESLSTVKGDKIALPMSDQTIIVHYINFDCTSCIQQIIQWKKFFEQNSLDLEKSLFIVGYGDYQRTVLVSKKIKFEGNILFDKDNSFNEINHSFNLKENKCIVITGNQYHQMELDFKNKATLQKLFQLLRS